MPVANRSFLTAWSMTLATCVFLLLALAAGAALAQTAPRGATQTQAHPSGTIPVSGEWLYIARGCLGCHGASAQGGVGPTLAATRLDLDAFLTQLRHPRGIMPAFPTDVVTREEAQAIHGYVRSLGGPPARIGAAPPSGVLDPAGCEACHAGLEPTIGRQFQASAMGRAGIQNPRVEQPRPSIGCADCHGTDHDIIMRSQGRVPETTCAGCHPAIYQEHVLDAGHSYGPGPAGIGTN